MNRILSTIIIALAFIGMDVGALAQTLSVDATSVRAGGNTVLVVKAEGLSADVSALQFNLALPQGATLDEAGITKGEAASSHTLEIRPLADNDRLFVLYNLDMASIGNGELLRLPMTMYAAAGEYKGSLNTVRTATSQAEKSQTLANTDIVINTYLNEDEFTAKTKEGVTMIFKILDKEAMTCQVGNGEYASVDETTVGKVTIPEVAKGYKVVAIGDKGFYNCAKLTHIYLHEGIESIGELAFYGCTSLRVLDLPSSIKTVTSRTFEGFSGSVNIPSDVVERVPNIVNYVPSGSGSKIIPPSKPQKQERIYIPKSVTSIAERCFSYCESVTKIEVESENPVFDSREGCNAIIRIEDNTLLYGCQKTKIPETVTAIADYAFEGHSHLKEITIPGKMATVGFGAFKECAELKDVYCLADTVPVTDPDAFKDTDISQATLYVPASSIDAYRTTVPWSGFGNFVALPDPLNYYDYGLTMKTLTDKAEWTDVLNSAPNAVAVVEAKHEEWAASQTNVIVEKNSEYYCTNFVLTDLTETAGFNYEKTGFYSPYDFTAKNGSYKRQAYAGYNTICVPFSFTASDLSETAKTYAFERYDDVEGNAIFKRVTGTVAAGTPCIVKESGNVVWKINLENKKISASCSSEDSHMMGTFVTTDAYQGNGYSPNSDNEFTPLSQYLHPFRACLILGSGPEARGIRLVLKDAVTDIDEVEMDNATLKDGKYLEKGKVVIYKSGRKHNANGSIIK